MPFRKEKNQYETNDLLFFHFRVHPRDGVRPASIAGSGARRRAADARRPGSSRRSAKWKFCRAPRCAQRSMRVVRTRRLRGRRLFSQRRVLHDVSAVFRHARAPAAFRPVSNAGLPKQAASDGGRRSNMENAQSDASRGFHASERVMGRQVHCQRPVAAVQSAARVLRQRHARLADDWPVDKRPV